MKMSNVYRVVMINIAEIHFLVGIRGASMGGDIAMTYCNCDIFIGFWIKRECIMFLIKLFRIILMQAV